MFTAVYLAAKLGQVAGKGLFTVIRERYPRPLLFVLLVGAAAGNTFEAGADIGGMAAALALIIPAPFTVIVVATAAAILALQVFGSYVLIRNVFRWLALVLLAYVVSAILIRPDLRAVLRGTFVPMFEVNRQSLSLLVAILGTSLSAYLY